MATAAGAAEDADMSVSSSDSSGSSDADAYEQSIRELIGEEMLALHEDMIMEMDALQANRKKSRTVFQRALPGNSAWAIWMRENRQYLGVKTNRAHVTFRRRFRVDYARFEYLYDRTLEARDQEDKPMFKEFPVDISGRAGISLEVKIMGALRVVGRASCMDSIAELSNCDGEFPRQALLLPRC
jgi:hypothetical protein